MSRRNSNKELKESMGIDEIRLPVRNIVSSDMDRSCVQVCMPGKDAKAVTTEPGK
jgi:hypothetical protein